MLPLPLRFRRCCLCCCSCCLCYCRCRCCAADATVAAAAAAADAAGAERECRRQKACAACLARLPAPGLRPTACPSSLCRHRAKERRERDEREAERLREQERIRCACTRWLQGPDAGAAHAYPPGLAWLAPCPCLRRQPQRLALPALLPPSHQQLLPPTKAADHNHPTISPANHIHSPLTAGRAGKELALAARQEEELRLKRMVEERQREKEEEARAREKIKLKLGEGSACSGCMGGWRSGSGRRRARWREHARS